MTYKDLDAKLQGRCKMRRKLGNNTYAVRRTGAYVQTSSIDILYHNTYILSFHPNGDITVDIGRWFTVTTKQRLNQFLPAPYRVWSLKGQWMIYGYNGPSAVFANGMVIHTDRSVSDPITGRVIDTITGARKYVDYLVDLAAIKKANRALADEKRVRCYTRVDGHYCNLYINKVGECARHGYLPLPGEDA